MRVKWLALRSGVSREFRLQIVREIAAATQKLLEHNHIHQGVISRWRQQ
jgi:hypothetical protein